MFVHSRRSQRVRGILGAGTLAVWWVMRRFFRAEAACAEAACAWKTGGGWGTAWMAHSGTSS